MALEIELDEAADEIIARDIVIDALNETVIEEDIEIDVLAESYLDQAALSEILYDELNTAYVIIGTKKELIEYGIIDKKGGFLGMGRVKSLAADADEGLFYTLPIDKINEIDFQCKKAKLLTLHSESSYNFSGDEKVIESLQIIDPIAFWDKSDFLVIEVVDE